jgi:hypothetical protein
MNDLSDLRTVDSQHMMSRVWDGPQRRVTTLMLRKSVRSNRCLIIQEIVEECDVSIGSCHDILTTKLGMHRVVSKFVPRLLTQDQRSSRVAIRQELLDRANEGENFLKTIVNGDETWVYGI